MNKNIYIPTLLLLSLLFGGCYEQHQNIPGGPWVLEAEKYSHAKTMKFPQNQAQLSSNQKTHLRHLIAKATLPGPVYAQLTINAPIINSVNQKRIETLTQYLMSMGLERHRIEAFPMCPAAAAKSSRGAGTILVSIDQYKLIEPDCPGWDEPMDMMTPTYGEKNYGCVSILNMIQMIAEPKDVYLAQKLALPDGPRETYFIKMYREDKIKQLIQESYTAGGQNSGSGSSSLTSMTSSGSGSGM